MTSGTDRASAVLTIDLAAVVANWRLLSAKLAPNGRCAAVVKADGYGLGARSVATALHRAGCQRFFVATLDEALALRPALPGSEIFVLNGPYAGTERDFVAADLRPALNSLSQVQAWRTMEHRVGQTAPAALQVDTGMARLGLTLAETARAAADQSVAPILLMSHLACADLPAHPLNATQAERFRQVRSVFPHVPGSLSASSGIFLGPAWHHDWARAGAALWGVNPTPDDPNPMAQVVRLKGKIVQLRDIDGGDTVGYGAAYRARRASRLAVVAVGYADGLLRSLEGRGIAHVGETAVPMVGRVSMDLVTFDVTDVPPHALAPGDFIDLIGPRFTIDQLAAAAQTSAYEILTGLGARFHRVYAGEPA